MKICQAAVLVLSGAMAAMASSCAMGEPTLSERLQNEDPQVRVKAVVEAGRWNDRKAMGLLVERLNDSEDEVRLFTIMALERITGKTMGYKFYDPPQARKAAVERWRAYVVKTASMPATLPATCPLIPPAPASAPAQRSAP